MLKQIAARRRCSVHALMKEAITRCVEREAALGLAATLQPGQPVAPKLKPYLYTTAPGPKAAMPERIARQLDEGNNRIRVLRGWRGMTRAKLLEALALLNVFIDARTLDAFEDDTLRPSGSMIGALAKALGVSVDELMG